MPKYNVELSDEQVAFLKLIYGQFVKDRQWPTEAALQKLVWRTKLDVEQTAGRIPGRYVTRDYSRGGTIKLRLPGLVACGEAQRDLDSFVRVVRLLVARLDEPEASIATVDMVQQLGMDGDEVVRVRAIMDAEYLVALPAESDRDGNPYVWKATDNTWRFADVQTIDDYIAIKDAYVNRPTPVSSQPFPGSIALPELEPGIHATDVAEELPSRDIFVAYPWAAYEDRAGYKAALTMLESELNVKFVFAESRLSEVHVLDKIESMITNTAFGIYDLTKWNPNVTLEYGYARGLGHTAFIAFNPTVGDSTDVPADIRGYDRIQYETFTELATEVRRLIVQQLGIPDRA